MIDEHNVMTNDLPNCDTNVVTIKQCGNHISACRQSSERYEGLQAAE